ncbi:NAD-dependent epimerase/dehydratase family protein [Pseudonocardia sp. HH130629-09]|uniref:NAD-dependent epimerase/dehydratase family protein n=1 Tax=Pseudonocardia sp. HH130629-09 TaxID=1641402 RepID=UPI0006CB5BC4|nr:hypothetical protein XF36_21505 [Pseudonocardia sp. HH130629-09]
MADLTKPDTIGDVSRVLLTGAAGFIGRNLALALESRGLDVVGVDDLSVTPLETYCGRQLLVKDVCKLSNTDIVGVDTIIHLASAKSVPLSFSAPRYYSTNVSMTAHLLGIAADAGVERILIGSTCEVYGDQGTGRLHEGTPFAPRSPYAASKAAMEMVANIYQLAHRNFSGCVTVARLFNVYGPGERTDALIPSLCQSALRYQRLPIEGDGNQRRDLTYIDDAVKQLLHVLFEHDSRVVNLGTGGTTSVLDVARLVADEVAGTSTEFLPARPNEIPSFCSNRGPLAGDDTFGKEMITIQDGIRRTLLWWRQKLVADPQFGEADQMFKTRMR